MKSNSQLVECVPNFSEGRDRGVLREILNSILSEYGCALWDRSSDADHNRSVVTIAGSPEAVEEAAVRFTRTAAELIDMEKHEGVHPCIGATDVIPFIPLKNISMEECILLSQRTGLRIAKELGLPVYFYARSAFTAKHVRLADIRRGGYHQLKEVIASDPDRAPDIGPHKLGPAGGVSIGARYFLIAWNVYLNTADPAPARRIAREIRESSGGLPCLQAIGLPVKGLAQVSMNLLDFRRTPMKTVFSVIQEKASALGCAPLYSELIGMLPAAALADTTAEELMIRNFTPDKIIENRF